MRNTTSKSKAVTSAQEGSNLPKLSQPAQRALAAAGIRSLKQLTRFSEDEVKQWHGIGPNALEKLGRALQDNGLSFASQKIKKT